MSHELGNFCLAMALGFAALQVLASWGGALRQDARFMALGRVSAFLQAGFLSASFLTLIAAFFFCDFSLLVVALHDHTQLPWAYRIAATWGNHEGSLLLFVLILSGMSAALAAALRSPSFRARALIFQGILVFLFLLLLLCTSNPFAASPFALAEGSSLNPLLQDRGLLFHPPLLYLGYVGFSAPFSLALAALWGTENGTPWATLVRPWALFAWGALTAGITLGSWWAYYELGWGGWWFWDPVENASLMPWLAGTALLHTLRTGKLMRWSLFLALLTFGLSLLGTFLVRSGLITSVHSFADAPGRGLFILSLLGGIMGSAFFLWAWKAPRLQQSPSPSLSPPLSFFSREGMLLLNSLLLSVGLATLLLGTLYPLWSAYVGGGMVAVGAPYFERTLIPLMGPLFLLVPIGSLLKAGQREPLLPLLIMPLTAVLGGALLLLWVFYPLSLWAFGGTLAAVWIIGGTALAYLKKRLSLGASLAHLGVAVALLGVSVGGGFRSDETRLLGIHESLDVAGIKLTLQGVQRGRMPTYLYERALLTTPAGTLLAPEKRVYLPQQSLLSETAISTNGWRDLYVVLGASQGNNRWVVRASAIPLAPLIWAGGALMVVGAFISFVRRRRFFGVALLFLSSGASFAETDFEKRAAYLNAEVRCPVCAGQSIADSETTEAYILKRFILESLAEGTSEETIREKLRAIYGDEILFRPPFEGASLFLWIAPFGIFILVLACFFWRGSRKIVHIL